MSVKKGLFDALVTHKLYKASPGKEFSAFSLKIAPCFCVGARTHPHRSAFTHLPPTFTQV